MRDVFQASPIDMGTFRTHPVIEEMLAGLELLDPGLVYAAEWWPDGPRVKPLLPEHHCMLAGVGRKPWVGSKAVISAVSSSTSRAP